MSANLDNGWRQGVTPRPRLWPGAEPDAQPPETPSGESTSWAVEYLRVVRGHWKLVTAFSLLGGITGFVLLLFQTPLYTATTSVEFLGYNDAFMDAQSVDPQSSGDGHTITSVNLQTQIRLLQSKALIDRARQKVEQQARPDAGKSTARLAALRQHLGIGQEGATERFRRAVDHAIQSLTPEMLAGTRIIEISCESTDPRVASDLVNALADAYVHWSSTSRLKSSQEAGRWLAMLLQDARTKLAQAERDLQERQLRSNIPGEKTNSLAETKVRQLQIDLSQAQNDLATRETRCLQSRSVPFEEVPEVRDDVGVRNYMSQLAGLMRDLANLSTTLGPQHFKIKQLNAQIKVIQDALKVEQMAVLERIRNDYESAKRRQELLAEEYNRQFEAVSNQQRRELSYTMAKREVDTARREYETLLQRAQQAQVVSAIPVATAQIVDSSTPAERPYKPKPGIFVSMGLATGTFLGLILAVVLDQIDSRVRMPKQMAAMLRVRTLGLIPRGVAPAVSRRKVWSRGAPRSPANGNGGLELTTIQDAPSAMAESFRATLASLMMEDETGYRPKVIVVTSAVPREGKTVVCCNLALAMAEAGQKVLLIDADLRNPRLGKIFHCSAENDLAGAIGLFQTTPPDSVDVPAQPTVLDGLKVLPCSEGRTQTASILYSSGLKKLIERARKEYHTILIDAPPLHPFSDPRIMGRLADGAVVVLRSHYSHREDVQDAMQQLREDGIPILGAILNDCQPERSRFKYLAEYQRRAAIQS
jgi:succinoglycan biosynthesis transport protein ExoP